MTIKDLRMNFHRETGLYTSEDIDKIIYTTASTNEYIKWLENNLIIAETYIQEIEKVTNNLKVR